MTGPTNAQVAVAPLSTDTEQAIRDACAAQGCTCGDRLRVTVRTLAEDEHPAGFEGYGKASAADVGHEMSCPLLAATGRN